MIKKILILFVAFIVLVALAVFFFLKPSSSNAPAVSPASTGSVSTSPAVPAVIKFSGVPQGPSFVMGTPEGSVTVNNFFLLPMVQDQEFLILENTNDYQITYDTEDSQFFIYASSSPLSAARAAGESAFLSMLGVSESDACKLNVAEGYPQGASLAGLGTALSFCGSGAFGSGR